jgi:hypothetical protein
VGTGSAARPADSELIRRLETEWRALAQSRWLQERLRQWASNDPRLDFEDGELLVEVAQRRDVANWAERDQVLSALLERVPQEALAQRVALQVVLPGLKSLIDGIRGWDVEERAARVVATALDVISWCASEPAGTPPSFRIYTNTRRRVLRAAIRARSEPVVFVDSYGGLDEAVEVSDEPSEGQRLDQLVTWVRQRGRLRTQAAQLVVMTRAGGFSIEDLAIPGGVDPQTLRQQRLRAESRVRQGLSLAI